MRKRTSQPTCVGQVDGAQVRIDRVHNDAQRELVEIVNRGTLAQPMGGWVLASLRGEQFYSFPDNIILQLEMMVNIHSGQGAVDNPPRDLLWAREEMKLCHRCRALKPSGSSFVPLRWATSTTFTASSTLN